MPTGRTRDKLPEKEETKQEALQEQEEIDEKEIIAVEETGELPKTQKDDINLWQPKTELGRMVKLGEITDINDVFEKSMAIKEAKIVDMLIPNIETDLLMIGQSKGKFGGGQRRVFKQTQKKTNEGNKPKFATYAVVGNRNGIVGIGYGKAKETVPAREKAIRNAKLNLIRIKRGCGSWQCGCRTPHSIPFAVSGRCGSVRIKLMPAPKGTGLRVEKECQKILKMVGVKDVWSRTEGKTTSKINLVKACFLALQKLNQTKIPTAQIEKLGIVDGAVNE